MIQIMGKDRGRKKNYLNSGETFKEQNNRLIRRVFCLKQICTLLEANANRTLLLHFFSEPAKEHGKEVKGQGKRVKEHGK